MKIKMKTMNHKLFYAVPAVLMSGAVFIGGLAWAANSTVNPTKSPDPPALKLIVSEQPVHRDNYLPASFAEVVKKVTPSVVEVSTEIKGKMTSDQGMPPELNVPFLRRFFGDQFQWDTPTQPMRLPPQRGVGSGVIVTKDGYILTNDHVVHGADSVKVILSDRRQLIAKVVGQDPQSDIAVLKVDAHNLPAIEIADSARAQVGDVVLAIGNPFGLGTTVTMGMVSAKGRGNMGIEDYEDFIQTDAAINPGNSGGALVDTEGRLIGINTAILSRSGGNQGIGFAIPTNLARGVMTSLVEHGKVVRGYLGVTIQDVTPELAKEFKLGDSPGTLVADVAPASPASNAGFADGDVVVKFNGQKVNDSRNLKLRVAETAPGETVPVEILRNGQSHTLRVKVGELPAPNGIIKAGYGTSQDTGTLNGVGVADLDASTRQQYHVPDKIQGAVITSVDDGSAAAEAGLKTGDVILEINRQKVKNADDAVRMTEHVKDKVTLLRLWSNGGAHFVVVDESKDKAS
jgi:serine protease Do